MTIDSSPFQYDPERFTSITYYEQIAMLAARSSIFHPMLAQWGKAPSDGRFRKGLGLLVYGHRH